ncbi:TonB-dependent receptor [Kineobactrum salinum]|uniref:TonB-dependent receptor n=1 Tax=Kineobactrum salinum TaxID=2708301 RepID=A0A6C0U606_9GAMM|nr:TonB-dependent receptor [Kineobactrum salinum]
MGLYYDEVPLGTNLRIPDLKAVDLNRIEVLRGPQGTLYGAGSMGGAIKLVGNRPNLNEFELEGSSELASIKGGSSSREVTGIINIPVVDEVFGVRAIAYHDMDGGWTDNVYLGEKNINELELNGGRLIAEWRPNQKTTVLGKIIYQDLNNSPGTARLIDDPYIDDVTLGFDETDARTDEYHKDTMKLYNLELKYDFGWADLISSTSFQDRDADTMVDLTTLTQFAAGVDDVVSQFFELTTYEDFVQEFRLTSQHSGPFEWQLGVFYNKLKHTYATSVPTPGFDESFGSPISEQLGNKDNVFESENEVDEEQVAIFTELSYALTDKWSVTAGLRWFDQSQDFSLAARGFLNGGRTEGSRKIGESDINPKFLVSYQWTDDVLIAAQAVRGFKLGGANDIVPAEPCAPDLAELGLSEVPAGFDSESAWNYEISAKTSFFDNRLVVNPSVYWIDYEELQVPVNLSGCGFKIYANGESARSTGVELEIYANPVEGLDLRFGGSYNDAQLTADLPLGVGLDGDRLPSAPKLQGSASARYTFPLTGALAAYAGYAQFGVQYMDETIMVVGWERSLPVVGSPTDASFKGNLRFGLESPRWEASLFVDNLWDERVSTFNRVTSFYSVHSVNQPRVIGLSVSARL